MEKLHKNHEEFVKISEDEEYRKKSGLCANEA